MSPRPIRLDDLARRRRCGPSTSPWRGYHAVCPAGLERIKATPSLAGSSHPSLPRGGQILSVDSGLAFAMGGQYSWDEVTLVRGHLEDMLQRGKEEMFEPWPIADLPLSSPSIWSRYSDQRLLERTSAIYSAALRIYEAMVNSWFGSFAGLRLSSLLPVRIEGTLTIYDERYDAPIPSLSWYPMILPTGEDSCIAFQLGPTNVSWHDTEHYFEDQRSAFARLRGGDPERVRVFYVGFSMLEDSSSRTATELAHKWLAEDLQRLGWLDP